MTNDKTLCCFKCLNNIFKAFCKNLFCTTRHWTILNHTGFSFCLFY